MPEYHFYKQHDRSDCGATCLRIIFRNYGKHFTVACMQQVAACRNDCFSLKIFVYLQPEKKNGICEKYCLHSSACLSRFPPA